MSLSELRVGGLLLLACLLLWGCPDGEGRFIPPQATAAPPGSNVFIYVAEGSDPQVGTVGGAVSAYQLGEDGLLPGGPPLSTIELVNPRRLAVHPAIPVLYVATDGQIVAFDISSGGLRSLCGGPGTGLAPPCATNPRGTNTLFDIAVGQDEDGSYTLYAAETGTPGSAENQSRIGAYPLGDAGELPGFAASQGTNFDAVQFEALSVSSLFVWASDTSPQRMYQFPREADGSLPFDAPTPTPINFPTPTPTPDDGATPTPSPEPTSSPTFFLVNFPGRVTVREFPNPTPNGNTGVLYAVEQGAQRLGAWEIDEFYALPFSPTSESPIQGLYNSIVLKPDFTRIYGALFQDGGIASYRLDDNGNIDASSEQITFKNPASFLTGLAYLSARTNSGTTRDTIFVSAGGLGRVDGYQVLDDGSLADRPFTSTEPRNDTFPTDVAINILPAP